MNDPFTVLVVEDNSADARFIEELLADARDEEAGVRLTDEAKVEVTIARAETLSAGLDRLATADVVLLDLNLPDSTGMETLERVVDAEAQVPIIVLTGVPESRLGVEAVSEGAQDYLSKEELSPSSLVRAIRYAVERHRSEEALRRRTEQLTLLNHLTQHDVRNDMTLVVGRAHELEAHVDDDGEAALDEVVSASNHVLQLTRSAANSVAAMVGEDAPTLAEVDLRPILTGEVETASRLYRTADIVVDGEIPDVQVRANRLLSSVFGNLLSNAMLYTDAESPEVRLSAEATEDTVEIRIADNGPGIPKYQQEEIFEKGVADGGGESGIGLYIVDQLVRLYDGDIDVENHEDGAVFTVSLQRVGTDQSASSTDR